MKKKQVTTKDEAAANERLDICYIGREIFVNSLSHKYLVRPTDSSGEWVEARFNAKLQKRHAIGYIYPAERTGDRSYVTRAADGSTGAWADTMQVAEWVRLDKLFGNVAAAMREKKQLKAAARKMVTHQVRLMYQRASRSGQVDIITAIVESLEGKS